jgi:hypothetical protein
MLLFREKAGLMQNNLKLKTSLASTKIIMPVITSQSWCIAIPTNPKMMKNFVNVCSVTRVEIPGSLNVGVQGFGYTLEFNRDKTPKPLFITVHW